MHLVGDDERRVDVAAGAVEDEHGGVGPGGQRLLEVAGGAVADLVVELDGVRARVGQRERAELAERGGVAEGLPAPRSRA